MDGELPRARSARLELDRSAGADLPRALENESRGRCVLRGVTHRLVDGDLVRGGASAPVPTKDLPELDGVARVEALELPRSRGQWLERHPRLDDESAIATLKRALKIDEDHTEARIYLGNIYYDRGDYEAALYHLDRSEPDDHWDELGIWRLIELKKMVYRLRDNDPELKPWEERLAELAGEPDDIDEMLAEIEAKAAESADNDAKGQLELFGVLLSSLAKDKRAEHAPTAHCVTIDEDRSFEGTWEEILQKLRESRGETPGGTIKEFMLNEARRGYSLTGCTIPTEDAESFIRGSADAGLLRIVR